MPVQEALILLQFLPKKGADVLWKLVKAASSNAENNLNIGASDLIVKEIKIGR
jgi:large subunit ribosomal protein L22